MHYDHVGNFHKFPKARFHLQEPEMHYAVGRHMRHKQLAKSFEPDDVCGIVRLNFDGRVDLLQRTGRRRCPGSASSPPADIPSGCNSSASTRNEARSFSRRMSRISTRTWRLTGRSPPRSISATCWTRSIRCAPMRRRREHIVPGHDPEVMRRYPAPSPALEGIVVSAGRRTRVQADICNGGSTSSGIGHT